MTLDESVHFHRAATLKTANLNQRICSKSRHNKSASRNTVVTPDSEPPFSTGAKKANESIGARPTEFHVRNWLAILSIARTVSSDKELCGVRANGAPNAPAGGLVLQYV
jgi:hypothetical protein